MGKLTLLGIKLSLTVNEVLPAFIKVSLRIYQLILALLQGLCRIIKLLLGIIELFKRISEGRIKTCEYLIIQYSHFFLIQLYLNRLLDKTEL